MFFQKTVIFLMCFASVVFAGEPKIVNVYNWAGYLPETILKKFEKETGIHVNHTTFPSNEALYTKLKSNPNLGYDVIVPSSYFLERMKKEGLLQKLDKSQLPYFKNLDPEFLNKPYDLENHYSAPFLWVATGIVVNQKYFNPKQIASWEALWESRFYNKILLLNDAREVFSIACLLEGFSVNTEKSTEIEKAYNRLKNLVPNIRLYNSESVRSILVDEDLTVGVSWNGDVYSAQQENPNLAFLYPKEGYVISLDVMAIPAQAKHVENAHTFINFLLRADIAKELALYTGFSTPNRAAYLQLPTQIRLSRILYPNKTTKNRAVFQQDVGESVRLYERYFQRLKMMRKVY